MDVFHSHVHGSLFMCVCGFWYLLCKCQKCIHDICSRTLGSLCHPQGQSPQPRHPRLVVGIAIGVVVAALPSPLKDWCHCQRSCAHMSCPHSPLACVSMPRGNTCAPGRSTCQRWCGATDGLTGQPCKSACGKLGVIAISEEWGGWGA